VWTSIPDAPLFRGTRKRVTAYWQREYGHSGVLGIERLLDRADLTGSSATLSGKWDERIQCREFPGGPGYLPRARMREFADLAFPGYPGRIDLTVLDANAEKISALLDPLFEDEDENDD
jgi:hypothetical protein